MITGNDQALRVEHSQREDRAGTGRTYERILRARVVRGAAEREQQEWEQPHDAVYPGCRDGTFHACEVLQRALGPSNAQVRVQRIGLVWCLLGV
jgi:hypothetical protein